MALSSEQLEIVQLKQKSQNMRLFDMVVLAPLLIYSGGKLFKHEKALGTITVLIGIGTALYNGKNYIDNIQLFGGSKT